MILYLALSIAPVPLFYLVYYRYFIYKPEYIKHVESLLYGIVCALMIIFVKNLLPPSFTILPQNNIFIEGIVKAALIEKVGCFFLIFLLHRFYPNFNIMESIVSAMLLGLGFSFVENIFYAAQFNNSVVLVRTTSSVVLHMTSCGIIGYYLGLSKMSNTFVYRLRYTSFALIIPVFFHGLYDVLLLMGNEKAYFVAIVLICLALILELMAARSITIMPIDILDAMNLRFEDWLTIDRQPRYERWIRNSMGTESKENIPFIKIKKGTARLIFIIIILISAILLSTFQSEISFFVGLHLNSVDSFYVFTIFPFSVMIILIIVGSVNPEFIESSIVKIPIISDVEVKLPDFPEETYVTYDITSANCFIRTYSPLEIGTKVELRFECPGFTSMPVNAHVVWENHENSRAAMGTIVNFKKFDSLFFKFLIKYQLFRFSRGFSFNLKLPGFEQTRKFFMRPDSVMSSEKKLKSGDVVYTEGDEAHYFYHLKKGYILIYKNIDTGDALLVDSINPGEIFGEMAIINDEVRTSTAICATDSVVGISEVDDLKALIVNNPEFAITLIETLGKRINITEKVLIEALKNEKNQNIVS